MPILIPLKLKHRNPNKKLQRRQGIDPPEGTWTFSGGKFKSKSIGQGTKGGRKTSGNGVRRRSYGPW